MENKTVLVTGGTDGIGRETVLQLARKGARVLVHGRDKEKSDQVIADINRETGNEKARFVPCGFFIPGGCQTHGREY